MTYVHLIHIGEEGGEADYELVLGPFEGVQLTYSELRETVNGEPIAWSYASSWYTSDDQAHLRPYSDIVFSPTYPRSVL